MDQIYINSIVNSVPSFNITSIDFTDCNNNGKFILIGSLSLDMNKDLRFQLPISYPENVTAVCSMKLSNKNSNMQISCQSNENFDNEIFKIAQISIFDDNKNEILTIEKYEEKYDKKIICENSKIITVNEKIENSSPISFRQVCKYKFENKKASFFFAGLTPKNLRKGTKIIITVLLYFKDNSKRENNIDCILESDVNPPIGGYAQGDFNCESDVIEGNLEELEILSSNNITGTENLKDHQKSPKKTDAEIYKTRYESGIGREIDYSSPSNKLISLPILSIKRIVHDKCENKGKIQLKGSFNEQIRQKFDFEIPLSYPISTIKCNAPKANKNVEVTIDCKVQDEFYGKQKFIIEPIIIKKKNKEFLIVKKFNQNDTNIRCADYNKKQNQVSKNKYLNPKSTLIQANSLNIFGGKLIFNLIILSFEKILSQLLQLNYIIRSYSYPLRNLEEEYDESTITCEKYDEQNAVGYYKCEKNNIGISNKSLIQEFIIDSDEITGIREDNNDVLEIDEEINNGKTSNYSMAEMKEAFNNIPNITNINIKGHKECNEGVLTLEGIVTNGKISKDGEGDINFISPPDSGALCKYSTKGQNIDLECHNKYEFTDESILAENQFVNETIFVNKFYLDGPISCKVGSLSYKEADDIYADNYANKYFSKTGSSGGLSGGAIAGIVIICCLVVISIGVLIALMKNGYFVTSKSRQDSSIPPITNSSANII